MRNELRREWKSQPQKARQTSHDERKNVSAKPRDSARRWAKMRGAGEGLHTPINLGVNVERSDDNDGGRMPHRLHKDLIQYTIELARHHLRFTWSGVGGFGFESGLAAGANTSLNSYAMLCEIYTRNLAYTPLQPALTNVE